MTGAVVSRPEAQISVTGMPNADHACNPNGLAQRRKDAKVFLVFVTERQEIRH